MAGKDWGALAKSGGLEKLKVGELKVRALYLVLGRGRGWGCRNLGRIKSIDWRMDRSLDRP